MPKPGARMPERIGKYVVIREVGRGSTGIVYLSHDAYYGRDVAIKVYNMDAGGDEERARELALTGGDDYELCFAVPLHNIARLTAELSPQEWRYTRIGALRDAPGAVVVRDGTVMEFSHSGYEHFA